jgi:hypothetical protein
VASLLPDTGTEFDDGDGDSNTKSFAVCVGTGVVTVTATPDPNVSEENLPGYGYTWGWTLEGGTGTSLLSRTVDKTTAGATTITCTCGSSSKTTKIYVVDVDLEKLSAGNSPDLEPGRICINAQACYKKAKWKAIVKGVGTASVTSTGAVDVTFSGIDGSNPSALADNDTFWAIGGTEIGTYEITITHNDLSTCIDTDTEKVFKFKFDGPTKTSDNGAVFPAGGEASRNDTGGWVDAPKRLPPVSNDSAGYVEWAYDLKVMTEPSGLYSGDVQAKANVTFESDGRMRIYCYTRPVLYDCIGISVGWGIVSVSISDSDSPLLPNYGDTVTGADIETKIGDLPRVQLGDVHHYSEEVSVPPWLPATVKTWDDAPGDGVDLSQERSDIERTYAVGSTVNEIIFKVGVASDISVYIAPEGTWAEENKQTIDSVTAEEYDGIFGIVP